jgi:hypothetical protein
MTPWSDDQKRAWDERQALKRQQIGVPVAQLLPTPAQQAQAERDRERRELAAIKAQGDPRERLREAHANLAEAKAEMVRRTESLDRAKALVEERKATLARMKADAEADRSTAVAALRRSIEDASAPVAGGPTAHETIPAGVGADDPVPAPSARALRAAEDLSVAEKVALGLAASLSEVDRRIQYAERQVAEAAVAVVIDHALSIADRIDAAAAALAELRQSISGVDRIWINGPVKLPIKLVRALGGVSGSVGPWNVILKALAEDPEAAVLP